ncbi:MAG: glutamine--fructose-6-phosphate transaminase (isomerizing) [Candidatus Omnitrophica bacterium]|nr:glutamine--fructose-6-phosphate transaminase (isomerizing) [Candidatus Omnitrophota bacterium]
MCGIIGYIGKKQATPIVVEALKMLEYRGYDSAGIATVSGGKLSVIKCKGRIRDLESILTKKVKGFSAIAHTRWATHGKPSKSNAHPHFSCDKKITVVHNGIIENYSELKEKLKKEGFNFRSETDTEVVAHLIGKFYKGNLKEALIKAIAKIKGSYALCAMSKDEPDKIVVARMDSPLVIGLGKGENFIASDVSALLKHTRKFIYLKDGEIAVITKDKINLSDLKGNSVSKKVDTVSYNVEAAQKEGFKHFMLKEICQQPKIMSKIISSYLTKAGKIHFPHINSNFFKGVDNLIIVACGTAYHAGLVGKYTIEKLARVPVWVDLGSEFRYRKPIINKKTLVIAISQSGETADTMAAVREARRSKAKVLSICNVLGSSLTRESDAVIYTNAGPEISVASTKAYTAQVMVLYLLSLYLAEDKKRKKVLIAALRKIPQKMTAIIKSSARIKTIAKGHLHFGAFLYLGRNVNFPTALEGALKLKEISYIPAEGYAAGEMKHGPIALIDEYRAVVCIANNSFVFDKVISNIEEIRARKGKAIIVATLGNKRVGKYSKGIIFIPEICDEFSSILTVVPLQLLAYYIADLKGFDVDKPRNLAKSVTVE